MDNDFQATISSPLGKIGVHTSATHLLRVSFIDNKFPMIKPQTQVAKETILQLQCYFADSRYPFEIPYQLDVSEFQKSVLNEMTKIPLGVTRSYGDLADTLSSSARAVGNACRHNPIPIIIPCHRVVAKNGIGGYNGDTSGEMITNKDWLLRHEYEDLVD